MHFSAIFYHANYDSNIIETYMTKLDTMSSAETIIDNIDINGHSEELADVDCVELAVNDVCVGRLFSSYEEALNSLQKWCDNLNPAGLAE